jgi:hypothetical protein
LPWKLISMYLLFLRISAPPASSAVKVFDCGCVALCFQGFWSAEFQRDIIKKI